MLRFCAERREQLLLERVGGDGFARGFEFTGASQVEGLQQILRESSLSSTGLLAKSLATRLTALLEFM